MNKIVTLISAGSVLILTLACVAVNPPEPANMPPVDISTHETQVDKDQLCPHSGWYDADQHAETIGTALETINQASDPNAYQKLTHTQRNSAGLLRRVMTRH